MLPLSLLLLSRDLVQAELLVALMLSLGLLLSSTYLLLGANYKLGFGCSYGLILALSIDIWPVSTQTITQSWLLTGLLLLTLLLIKGSQESAFVNMIIVFIKVAIVLIFIAVGWQFIQPANHTPYLIPEGTAPVVDNAGRS
mgnify:CR=1 FL=1